MAACQRCLCSLLLLRLHTSADDDALRTTLPTIMRLPRALWQTAAALVAVCDSPLAVIAPTTITCVLAAVCIMFIVCCLRRDHGNVAMASAILPQVRLAMAFILFVSLTDRVASVTCVQGDSILVCTSIEGEEEEEEEEEGEVVVVVVVVGKQWKQLKGKK